MNIIIAYHSGSGHTRKLAECIKEGAELEPGCQVGLIDVGDSSAVNWDALHGADAIIFGSPTYMGSASGPFKTFLDATSEFWLEYKWADKVAAGFTVGSGPSGDKLSTLMQIAIFACQHSMIWVGQDLMSSLYTHDAKDFNRDASFLGFMATASRDKTEINYEVGSRECAYLWIARGQRDSAVVERKDETFSCIREKTTE